MAAPWFGKQKSHFYIAAFLFLRTMIFSILMICVSYIYGTPSAGICQAGLDVSLRVFERIPPHLQRVGGSVWNLMKDSVKAFTVH